MELSIYSQSKFLKNDVHVLLSLKTVFILANSADPDKMPPYVAFYLGLHCLPKYLFTVSRMQVVISNISSLNPNSCYLARLVSVNFLSTPLHGLGSPDLKSNKLNP